MIIIIQPGSLNLTIGRASDVNPHRMLHAIARRRKPRGHIYRDTILSRTQTDVIHHIPFQIDTEVAHTCPFVWTEQGVHERARRCSAASFPHTTVVLAVGWSATVRHSVAADRHIQSSCNARAARSLDTAVRESAESKCSHRRRCGSAEPERRVQRAFPDSTRRFQFARQHWRFGDWRAGRSTGNLEVCTKNTSEHFAEVLAWVGFILGTSSNWNRFVHVQFCVDFSELYKYKAVLLVPDIYNRGHLRELMHLLLLKIGFGSCFLVQVLLALALIVLICD